MQRPPTAPCLKFVRVAALAFCISVLDIYSGFPSPPRLPGILPVLQVWLLAAMSSTMPSLSSSSSAPSPPPGQSLSPPSRPTPTGGNQNAFPAGPGLQLTSSASLYCTFNSLDCCLRSGDCEVPLLRDRLFAVRSVHLSR